MRVRVHLLWAAILSLALALGLSGAWASHPAQAQPVDSSTLAAPAPQTATMEELVDQRTRHRKLFKYDEAPTIVDGKTIERRTAQVGLVSLHYKDTEGQWQDVDTTAVETDTDYRADKVNVPVRLPKSGDGARVVQIGGETLTVSLVDAQSSSATLTAGPGAVNLNQVTYADIFEQTDIAYQIEPDGVREFITLKAAGHPSALIYAVQTDLTLRLEEGEVIFYNSAGEAVGKFARPWVAVPGSPPTTRWGDFSLDGNQLTMTLPDLTGLDYPIVVDPTVADTTTASNDAYAVSTGSWSTGDIRVNLGKGGSGETYNTVLRFEDFDAIPQGTDITGAEVEFRADNTQSATTTQVEIAAGVANTTMPSNFSDWSGRTRSTATEPWTIGAVTSGNAFYSPDITDVIQEAVDSGGFSGTILLYFDDDGSTAGATRSGYSYEGNNTASPKLTIDYDVQTTLLYVRFTENVNETNEVGLTFSDIDNLQVDYLSGSNPYVAATFSGASTTHTCSSTTYYRQGMWTADVSTSVSSAKWRVRIPSSTTAYDTGCSSSTNSQAAVLTITTVLGFGSGVDNYTMGLGLWP